MEQTLTCADTEHPAVKKIKSPFLLNHIIEEVHKKGVVNEDMSIAILALKLSIRLVKDAKPSSSNTQVSDRSGGGKDWLVKNVFQVLTNPEVTGFMRSSMSEKALNYWIDTDWNGKALYIRECTEELLQSQAFKTLTGDGETSATTLIKQKLTHLQMTGKPAVIVTAYKSRVDNEGIRRWDTLTIDTSKETTRDVVNAACLLATGKKNNNQLDDAFIVLLHQLQVQDVVIPYAEELASYFTSDFIQTRTLIHKFLDFIRASAVLHQNSREKDAEGRIIATNFDYMYARMCFLALVPNMGLNKTEKDIMKALEGLYDGIHPVKTALIEKEVQRSRKTILDHLDNLQDKDLVLREENYDSTAMRDIPHWQPKPFTSVDMFDGTERYDADWKVLEKMHKWDEVKIASTTPSKFEDKKSKKVESI